MKYLSTLGFILFLFSCNSDLKENGLSDENPIDTVGITAYVSFNSQCPNCLRSKSALIEAASAYPSFKWKALLIDDLDSSSLPSAIFDKYQAAKAKKIAKRLHLKVTPEVFLMSHGKKVYQGAITDQNKAFGQGKLVAQSNYLMNACKALRVNPDTSLQSTKAIGCFIEFNL